MTALSSLSWPVWFASITAATMIIAGIIVFFFHDRKYEEIEHIIDFSYSNQVLGQVLLYYRGFFALMGFFLVVFTLSLFSLQKAAGLTLFEQGQGSLLGMLLFSIDLIARGAFFDWMEHWALSMTPLTMNRELTWFVIYAFIFRMFYALTLLRILISFAWIWRKISLAKREIGQDERHDQNFPD